MKIQLKNVDDYVSIAALPIEQNGQRFYFTTVPKADIVPYCFVSRRDEAPEAGFQRTLDERRATDISRYLDDSKGSIPTNIVLSAQPAAELKYFRKTKTVRFKRASAAFLVLDGQHRLFGYSKTRKDHRVPVAIYEGLEKKAEVALFIDINTTQRGVPAALLLDIKHLAERENMEEQELRSMFDELSRASDSPLNGLLSASISKRGRLARPAFNRAVLPVVRHEIMAQLQKDSRILLLKNYIRAWETNLTDRKLLTTSSYFEAFCAVFDETLRVARDRFGDYKLKSLTEVLAPFQKIDLTNIHTGGQTKISRNTIVPVLLQTLKARLHVNDGMI